MSQPERNHVSQGEKLAQQAEAERRRLAIVRIEDDVRRLAARLAACDDRDERIGLKSEIAHLRRWKDRIESGRWYPLVKRRKPPEAGLTVPAVPPHGPLPKKGGAAAPLDFDRS